LNCCVRTGVVFGIVPGLVMAAAGCGPVGTARDRLVIATTWRSAERLELEFNFGQWWRSSRSEPAVVPEIVWIPLAPVDDVWRLVVRRPEGHNVLGQPIDVLLGGPAAIYDRLGREGRLVSQDPSQAPAWRVVRHAPLGWAVYRSTPSALDALPTFDDPRHDSVALDWARATLAAGAWSDGYAALVRAAGNARRIGRQPRSALAAVERGDAVRTPAAATELPRKRGTLAFAPVAGSPDRPEGVAIVSGGKNRAAAEAFLAFLTERGGTEVPHAPDPTDGTDESLLADLLGATLVDAQDELWVAWATLQKADHPGKAEMWMTQAPPWPPASVNELLVRDPSGLLCDTLAEQVCPDPQLRAWLVRSWLGPKHLIDGRVLAELAGAGGGKLAREPRFRSWLRAEWRAWARQRYRRVARKAGEHLP
jgi:hypothetical protein